MFHLGNGNRNGKEKENFLVFIYLFFICFLVKKKISIRRRYITLRKERKGPGIRKSSWRGSRLFGGFSSCSHRIVFFLQRERDHTTAGSSIPSPRFFSLFLTHTERHTPLVDSYCAPPRVNCCVIIVLRGRDVGFAEQRGISLGKRSK